MVPNPDHRFIAGTGFVEAETDLHLATHHTRIVKKSGDISFLGRRWEPPGETKQLIIAQQPRNFRVIAHTPTPQLPQ